MIEVVQWVLLSFAALCLLLILAWILPYFASRAWYTAKLNAISRFAARVRQRRNHL